MTHNSKPCSGLMLTAVLNANLDTWLGKSIYIPLSVNGRIMKDGTPNIYDIKHRSFVDVWTHMCTDRKERMQNTDEMEQEHLRKQTLALSIGPKSRFHLKAWTNSSLRRQISCTYWAQISTFHRNMETEFSFRRQRIALVYLTQLSRFHMKTGDSVLLASFCILKHMQGFVSFSAIKYILFLVKIRVS
jgi:hypothetical protein